MLLDPPSLTHGTSAPDPLAVLFVAPHYIVRCNMASAPAPAPHRHPLPHVLSNYIGGSFLPASTGATLEDRNPATDGVIATIPRSAAADIDAAVAAARAAFPAWARTSPLARAALLDKIADLIEAEAPALAAMESEDAGKTLRMATSVDIPRAVANFRFFAGQLRHDETGSFPMHDAINYSVRVPVGVAGLITPWNLPLYCYRGRWLPRWRAATRWWPSPVR